MATLSLNIRGPAGAKGPTGDQGPTGGAGATGTQGDPGATGAAGPTVVSANSGNQAKVGTDSKLWTPGGLTIPLADSTKNGLLTQVSGLTTDYVTGQNACADLGAAIKPTIWSGRQSPNAIGNSNFEVDSRNVFTSLPNALTGWVQDRWYLNNTASPTVAATIANTAGPVVIPGTNYTITNRFLRFTVTTSATFPSNKYYVLQQYVEGPSLRELLTGVHSLQLLVRSSVAGLLFGITLNTSIPPASAGSYGLAHLCTLGAANTWTLITIPSILVWTSNATWSMAPGNVGYVLNVCLGCSARYINTPTNDVWLDLNSANGGYGAFGQQNSPNFFTSAVGTTFDIAFVQHEPGPVCTALTDIPFHQNLRQCQRYYAKSFGYSLQPGVVGSVNAGYKQLGTWMGGPTVRMDSDYPVPMAKKPTITMWGFNSTSSNVIYIDSTGTNIGASTIANDTRGLQNVALASTPTGNLGAPALGSFTADTGW
jgi:hypothetical protein